MSGRTLIVVGGPTAVGKTAVAIQLAEHFRAAIVSADSRQIYREMVVGTAKPSAEERARVPHYFVDTHTVAENYDAATYATDARKVIDDLFRASEKVILCGGSGLYIRGVCEGFDDIPGIPEEVRQEIVGNYERNGLAWLQEEMRRLDPEGFEVIDWKNPHRLMRALEVKIHTGESIFAYRKKTKITHPFRIVKIALDLPRETLYQRIDARMDDMIAAGLFEEARSLYPMRHYNALQTVGYQEIFAFMDHAYDLEECVRLLKRNSRRYAKRQLTWFKKDPEFRWFAPGDLQGMITFVNEATNDK